MRRIAARPILLLVALALVTAACSGDDDGATDTTVTTLDPATATSTTQPAEAVTTTTTTTTTLPPGGPPMIEEGDDNETVEAFQWLIDCNGYADLTVDGDFGPGTLAAVEAAQAALGRPVTGAPDEETLAELSRGCSEDRRLTTERRVTVVGNSAPDDPERYAVALVLGSTLTVTLVSGEGITVTVTDDDGFIVEPDSETTWPITTSGDYLIQVTAEAEPVTFELDVEVAEDALEEADWLITTTGISYRGTKLSLGDPAGSTIDKIFDFLGHGVRGGSEEYDTGWDFPGQEGFRGIVIEGFRFLFYGPNADDPGRPETFGRVRVVEPTTDAEGEPRPPNYVTTPEGIGVGNTLLDLKTVYDDFVAPGSNSEEHYYRLSNAGGELCFYFGDSAPGDSDPILEISTECRS